MDIDPAVEELLGDAAAREGAPPSRRDFVCEALVGIGLLGAVAALALAAPGRPTDGWLVAALVVLYAAVGRVRFDVGAGSTSPTELVLVPMLFYASPALVPLLVAAGIALRALPEVVRGQTHPARLVSALPDAWHAVGPALVLALAGADGVQLSDWPLYVGAFAAQVGFDVAASTIREWLIIGVAPSLQLRLMGWIAGIDACLAPIGLLAAIAMASDRLAILLVLPPTLLLLLFARERDARIRQALQLSSAYRGTARLMGDMLEADDAYTGGEHSRGVVELSLAVGLRMRLSSREQRDLEFGALLHDIGKLRVPNELINKPGALNTEEWEIIRRHPADGQAMLERVGGTLGQVGRIVRAHHERVDGGGYPDGLRGEEIPLAARIIAACDSYSAMTTTRAYRPAMTHAAAVAELRACTGTQFDPVVVAVLLEVVGDGMVPAPATGPARILA